MDARAERRSIDVYIQDEPRPSPEAVKRLVLLDLAGLCPCEECGHPNTWGPRWRQVSSDVWAIDDDYREVRWVRRTWGGGWCVVPVGGEIDRRSFALPTLRDAMRLAARMLPVLDTDGVRHRHYLDQRWGVLKWNAHHMVGFRRRLHLTDFGDRTLCGHPIRDRRPRVRWREAAGQMLACEHCARRERPVRTVVNLTTDEFASFWQMEQDWTMRRSFSAANDSVLLALSAILGTAEVEHLRGCAIEILRRADVPRVPWPLRGVERIQEMKAAEVDWARQLARRCYVPEQEQTDEAAAR